MRLGRALAALFIAASLSAAASFACSGTQDHVADSGSDARADASIADSPAVEAVPDGARDGGRPALDGGSPRLVSLSVTGFAADSSTPLTLTPAFSPGVFDYYVRCAAGENALTVTMAASPGASSLLTRPILSAASPKQTLHVGLYPNQAVVAAATDGVATVGYWVRCLPPDFPGFTWTEHPEAGAPTPGFYLLGTDGPPPGSGSGDYAIILDGHGVPVWYAPRTPPTAGIFNLDHLVEGTISYYPYVPGSVNGMYVLRQLASGATTTVGGPGLSVDQHDLRLLSNGDYLVIASPQQGGVNLTGMMIPLGDGGVQVLKGPQVVVACDLIEFAPDGGVVWSWRGLDHFDPDKDTTWPQRAPTPAPDGGPSYGVFHCNSVDVDPANGNLLVSARHMDTVFYVEKATGTVLWKMGGSPESMEGATYVPVASPFFRQHDARLLPGATSTCAGWKGRVSLFDDQTEMPGPARAVVYDVTVAAPDGGGPGCDAGIEGGLESAATVVWQHEGTLPSEAMGSFRISADGSRVIGWGVSPSNLTFTDVDLAHHDLLDFGFTDGNTSFRVIKVPPSTFDRDVLRNTVGLP